MAHLSVTSAYREMASRLNRFPQGAPASELLYRILELLVSEREAALIAQLPVRPFTAARAARIWKTSLADAESVLDELSGRAVLVDIETDDGRTYVLPPPMAGFFEFSMMRTRGDLDQRLLAELFYEYLNVEDEFITALFTHGETQLGRTFVAESAIPTRGREGRTLEVLDHERASEVVRTATSRAVGMCYCRHKMQHVGRACDAPMDICMTFNNTASSLIRHGHAKPVGVHECLDLLDEARDRGLVQFGENVRRRVNFICNCCGCCCEALIAARRFGHLHPVHTTGFLPEVDPATCTGCGKCVSACPVEAMSLVSANDPNRPKRKLSKLAEDICLGCGVCVPACPEDGIRLARRERHEITPLDSVHRTVVMATERGVLQHLLFDNHVLWSHRALAAVFGAVLRLPPLARGLARTQLRSRFFERLLERRT